MRRLGLVMAAAGGRAKWTLALVCLLTIDASAGADAPDTRPWSQHEARALGHRVAEAANELSLAVNDSRVPESAWESGVRLGVATTTALLLHQAKSLRVQLIAGVGRTETQPLFDQIGRFERSLEADRVAGRLPDAVGTAVQRVRAALDVLAPLYASPTSREAGASSPATDG